MPDHDHGKGCPFCNPDEHEPEARPYRTPVLTVYGTASDVTGAIGQNGHDDGGGDKTRL